jgi:rubrerythrin
MEAQLALGEVLERAIRKEIEAQRLYVGMSAMIDDPASKEACQKLAQEERGHQHQLERYQRGDLTGGALSKEHPVDYKIAEMLGEPEMTETLGLKEVFLLAANREKASHDFYMSLGRIHPEGQVKSLLEELAAQELGHKHRVESLYTEVAFPQTDGG